MTYVWPVICILAAAGIQGNLPSWMTIFGAKPDLVLVVLISYSLAADPEFGAGLGFIAGLVQGSIIGISMASFVITRTVTGFLAGLVNTRLFGENPLVPVISAGWLTLACEFLFLLANPRPVFFVAARTVLGECIYNSILTIFVYLILRQFENNRKIKLANARL